MSINNHTTFSTFSVICTFRFNPPTTYSFGESHHFTINGNVISHLSQITNALTVDSLREVCYTGFSSAKEGIALGQAFLDQPKESMFRLLPLDSPRDAYK